MVHVRSNDEVAGMGPLYARIVRWAMADAFRSVDVTRIRSGARKTDVDCAATEEPLEIRLHGRPFAVVMRTPGHDLDLAAALLLAAPRLDHRHALGPIQHCT